MYIGNIPQELRVSRKKKGGAVLLGHIPEVCAAVLSQTDDANDAHRSLGDQETRMRLSLTTVPGFTIGPY